MRRPWTPREIATLREKYGKVAAGIIARELGRTTKAVQNQAGNIGVDMDRRTMLPWPNRTERLRMMAAERRRLRELDLIGSAAERKRRRELNDTYKTEAA